MKMRAVSLLLALGVSCAHAAPLDDLLRNLQANQLQENKEIEARLQHFREIAQERKQLLKQVKADIKKEEKRSRDLEKEFRAGEKKMVVQREKLDVLIQHHKEVFATAKLWAADLKDQFQNSLISAQYPQRAQKLEPLLDDNHAFTVEDMNQLVYEALNEAHEQGKVVRFLAQVTNPDGTFGGANVIRIGAFTATSKNRFLSQASDSTDLMFLPRQPRSVYRTIAAELEVSQQEYPLAVIDPSRGSILSLLADAPDLGERIEQGGPIGYIIIAIGIFGIFFAIMRNIMLNIQLRRILRQHHDLEHPNADNALGRIALVYQEHRGKLDPEALEDRVHEAVSEELPKLSWGLNLLRVLAAIAPLLGLLGTVTGMIQTFQDITLFGTGDPRMMAGGISQALITTALGLTAAIPILLLLTMARAYSTRIRQIVDEQSLGLLTRALQT